MIVLAACDQTDTTAYDASFAYMIVSAARPEVSESRIGQLCHVHCGPGAPGLPVSRHLRHRDEEHCH